MWWIRRRRKNKEELINNIQMRERTNKWLEYIVKQTGNIKEKKSEPVIHLIIFPPLFQGSSIDFISSQQVGINLQFRKDNDEIIVL